MGKNNMNKNGKNKKITAFDIFNYSVGQIGDSGSMIKLDEFSAKEYCELSFNADDFFVIFSDVRCDYGEK